MFALRSSGLAKLQFRVTGTQVTALNREWSGATPATHLLNSFNSLSDEEEDNGASSVAAVGRLINIFKQRGCLPMAGTSRVRVDTDRSDVSINC